MARCTSLRPAMKTRIKPRPYTRWRALPLDRLAKEAGMQLHFETEELDVLANMLLEEKRRSPSASALSTEDILDRVLARKLQFGFRRTGLPAGPGYCAQTKRHR